MTLWWHNINMKTKEQILNIFVERLKDLMIDKNIKTIADLSRHLSIPRTTLNDWFLKLKLPRLDYLIEVAKFFNVSLDYLVGLEN